MSTALLHAAVAADPWRWDLLAPGTRDGGAWRPVVEQPGVPGLVTLRPGLAVHPGAAELVRDSFADLDLRGYATLVNGAWLVRPPSQVPPSPVWAVLPQTSGDGAAWLDAWGDDTLPVPGAAASPPPPSGSSVRLLARQVHGRITGGALATVHDGVVSLAHLFTAGKDLAPVWAGAADLVGVTWPGLPVVSHDSGTGLACAMVAGFRQLGPMRLLVHL